MSETKYINEAESKNRSRKRYHTDPECHALSDNYREMTDHDERINALACSYCAGDYTASEIVGLWDDE